MSAWLNRDLLLGGCAQCHAWMERLWAWLRRDPRLRARSGCAASRASVRARYGFSRASAAWRLRRLERGL